MSGKVNLDRWGPHLLAAKREGKSLTQYARSRGLSRHTLYAAKQMRAKHGWQAGCGAAATYAACSEQGGAAIGICSGETLGAGHAL